MIELPSGHIVSPLRGQVLIGLLNWGGLRPRYNPRPSYVRYYWGRLATCVYDRLLRGA